LYPDVIGIRQEMGPPSGDPPGSPLPIRWDRAAPGRIFRKNGKFHFATGPLAKGLRLKRNNDVSRTPNGDPTAVLNISQFRVSVPSPQSERHHGHRRIVDWNPVRGSSSPGSGRVSIVEVSIDFHVRHQLFTQQTIPKELLRRKFALGRRNSSHGVVFFLSSPNTREEIEVTRERVASIIKNYDSHDGDPPGRVGVCRGFVRRRHPRCYVVDPRRLTRNYLI